MKKDVVLIILPKFYAEVDYFNKFLNGLLKRINVSTNRTKQFIWCGYKNSNVKMVNLVRNCSACLSVISVTVIIGRVDAF